MSNFYHAFSRKKCPKSLQLLLPMLFAAFLQAQTFTDATSTLDISANGFEWGASAADFNNDGLVDIYHPGRLYLNTGSGFVNVLSSSGINEGSSIFGAVFGDYNNDGYLDVLFEDFSFGSNSRLFRNDKRRTFTRIDQQVGLAVTGLTQGAGWGDFNNDGQLDLFVNEDTGDNQLFMNSQGAFSDVTVASGVATNGNSYGMSWGDYNNDGFSDVFIATCNSSPLNSIKHLLRNNGDGTFTDVNYAVGVADSLASWGITWLDYDNNGTLDVYIANTNHGSAQPGFNTLYHNNGNDSFSRREALAGVAGQQSNASYAVGAADFDNDGWIDIYVGNSNATHRLYRNNGNGTFSDVAFSAGIVEDNHQAIAVADYNNDGWMDVFTAGSPANRLMLNDGGTNHWIGIETRGVQSTYHGVGARITLYTNGIAQLREIRAGDSFCSQNDLLRAHFGLGTAMTADSIVIRWPAGTIDRLYQVEGDRYVTIREGAGLVASLPDLELTSPAEGDTVRSNSSLRLSWNARKEVGTGNGNGLSYNLHLWGTGVDTVYTGIEQNTVMVDVSALTEGAIYRWMVEVTDGYAVKASPLQQRFVLRKQVFLAAGSGSIVSDQRFSEGGSWGDYDNDGDLDLFVSNIYNQDNLLYQNDGNGVFSEVSGIPPVTAGGFSYGSHWIDADNDNDLDLFVINGGANQNLQNAFYRNDGGFWTAQTSGELVQDANASWSGAWADYDNDGDADVFVANYNQPNALYENQGNGVFVRQTGSALGSGNTASLGCAWADYDNDGDADLFVANADFAGGQANLLYRNDGNGVFVAVSGDPVVQDVQNSVGGSWGDYNNDGFLDLFVTNYFGENNRLYQNNGDGSFALVSNAVPGNDGGLSVGSSWGDYDNDGDLDLVVSDDGNSGFNRLYKNNGDGSFSAVSGEPVVSDVARSNSVTWSDADDDGDLDLFVANGNEDPNPFSNFYYRNRLDNGNAWLKVKLQGTLSNTQAIGARVYCLAQINGVSTWQMQEVSSQTGYNSQNSLEVEFGLGNAAEVDSLRILWPSGQQQSMAGGPVNNRLTIVEDNPVAIDPQGNRALQGYQLAQNYPNPFNPETVVAYTLPQPETVRLEIFNLLGQRVRVLIEKPLPAGEHRVVWNGRDDEGRPVQSGIYFYRLQAGEQILTRKMTLLR